MCVCERARARAGPLSPPPQLELLTLGCFTRSPSFRRRTQACFGAKGEQLSSAASLAALIGGKDPSLALGAARARFRCVRLCDISYESLATPAPDPTLFKKSTLARIGDVDAFAV